MAINGKGRPTKEQAEQKRQLRSWLDNVSNYDREFTKWCSRSEKILKRYRDERTERDGSARFNILWSNVQTLVPATFSKLPQPDVSRRFRDNDPVGRVAALILERAEDFEIQHYPDYRATMKACVHDRFLGGRGTAWARYEPHFKAAQEQLPPDGAQVTDDIDEPQEELDYECAPVDYVHWKDFGHSVARTWEEVTRVWRKVYMYGPAKVERFGELAKKIPLDSKPKEAGRDIQSDPADDGSWIYEGWDKSTKKAVWFHKGFPEYLDERDDPLGLEGFFPCPRPLYSTLTNDSLVPVPDFTLYQDQAIELDTLAERIDGLIKALQVKGTYDASVPELARLFTEGNNGTLIPVKNWAAFVEKNGLVGALSIVDLKPIADALKAAYEAFAQVIQFIYEITGLSDIIRGQSDPNETLGAQQMKGQYASLRLKDAQQDVALFATSLLQLKAQIMCAKFSPETLMQIAAVEQLAEMDKQHVPAAMALLLGPRMEDPDAQNPNPLRAFRIEVSADTLVQIDEQAEQEAATQFVVAVGTYMEKAVPVIQAAPDMAPLIMGLLRFVSSRYKVGKTIEGLFDEAEQRLKQASMQPKPPPPPDPALVKVQAEAKAKEQELAQKAQAQQADMQAEGQRMQMEQQAQTQRMGMEAQAKERELQQQAQLEQQRLMMERMNAEAQAREDAAFARFEALLKAKTAVQVAEIGAEASVKAAENRPEPDA